MFFTKSDRPSIRLPLGTRAFLRLAALMASAVCGITSGAFSVLTGELDAGDWFMALFLPSMALLPMLVFLACPHRSWPDLFAWTARNENGEHSQALLRIAVVSAAFLSAVLLEHFHPVDASGLVMLTGSMLIGAWLILLSAIRHPAPCSRRGIFGIAFDVGGLSLGLYLGGQLSAAWYPVYLWIMLANGFRFGLKRLVLAALFSVLGFAGVIAATEYWRDNAALAAGLMIALILLPVCLATQIDLIVRALNEANDVSAAKSRFLATMSHELRTPLNAIIGFSSIMEAQMMGPLPARYRQYSSDIRKSGDHLLDLINQILDLSKIESGNATLSMAAVDVSNAADMAQRLL